MKQKLKDIFIDGEQPIYQLQAICDEMVGDKFVIAESKISEILMVIASSTVLHELVKMASKNYDFLTSFKNARVVAGRVSTLVMPTYQESQVAFVVNLLYSFDTGVINLSDFLSEFYADRSLSMAYLAFVRNIILPFKKNIEMLYNKYKRGVEQYVDDIRLNSDQVSQALNALYVLRQAVRAEAMLTHNEKNELLTYIDGMGNSISAGRYSQVKGIFSALLNVARALRLSEIYYDKEAYLKDVFKFIGI